MASTPTPSQPAEIAVPAPVSAEVAPSGLQSRANDKANDVVTMQPIAPAPPMVTTTTSWLRWLLGLGVLYAVFYLGAWTNSRSIKPPLVGPFITDATPHSAPAVIVQVAGAVAHPGVYHLPFDARITDAIHEAGGPLPDADTNALNLAAWVEDGTRIEVLTKAASVAAAPPPVALAAPPAQTVAAAPPAPTLAPPAPAKVPRPRLKATKPAKSIASVVPHAITPSGKTSKKIDPAYLAQHPIDVNTALATDLEELPGIGPAMAAKIIAYRQENGRFQTVDDLRNVKGIGEKKLAKLESLVTVK